jgi:hypothetical protein
MKERKEERKAVPERNAKYMRNLFSNVLLKTDNAL